MYLDAIAKDSTKYEANNCTPSVCTIVVFLIAIKHSGNMQRAQNVIRRNIAVMTL